MERKVKHDLAGSIKNSAHFLFSSYIKYTSNNSIQNRGIYAYKTDERNEELLVRWCESKAINEIP